MEPNEVPWPLEDDLLLVEFAEYVLLGRVLAGLRRLSFSDPPPRSAGARMSRDTTKLVDSLRATQSWIGLLVCKLQDGTATADEQRQVADRLDELLDLLQSYAADTDAGIVPEPRHLLLAERHTA